MAGAQQQRAFRFGSYEFDSDTLELRKSGVRVRLSRKPAQALELLLANPGRVVSREQFCEKLWGSDTFGDFEDSLNHAIQRLREALDDDPKRPARVETLPSVGYRFIAHVETEPPQASAAAPATSRRSVPYTVAAATLALLALVAWRTAAPDRVLAPVSNQFNPPVIAVLPFENLSGDPAHQLYAEGVADALINELAKISALRVISRTSTLRYRNPSQSLPEIAERLGATHIVEGSALFDGESVRITVQLIDSATDEHVWADTHEQDSRVVVKEQSRLAAEIARAIHVELTAEERSRLASTTAASSHAYTAYLRARDAMEGGDWDQAIPLLERAVDLDPSYTPAQAWLAEAYALYGWWNGWPPDSRERARRATLRIHELDGTQAEPHMRLGQIRSFFDREWEDAEQHFLRALELNPSHVHAHLTYAQYLLLVNRVDEALEMADRALLLDPWSANTAGAAGEIYHGARRYGRAIELIRSAREMRPEGPMWTVQLGCIYTAAGQFREAIEHLGPSVLMPGPDTRAQALLAWAHAMSGDQAAALSIERRLQASWPASEWTRHSQLILYSGLGDLDRAFALVDEALTEKWPYLAMLAILPPYDRLREDPRYDALLERIGLRELRERNAETSTDSRPSAQPGRAKSSAGQEPTGQNENRVSIGRSPLSRLASQQSATAHLEAEKTPGAMPFARPRPPSLLLHRNRDHSVACRHSV